MSDKEHRTLHGRSALSRSKSTTQIQCWARPDRGKPSGAVELVGGTDKYQSKADVFRRNQSKQNSPVFVPPILAWNLSTDVDGNEITASERCQLLCRQH